MFFFRIMFRTASKMQLLRLITILNRQNWFCPTYPVLTCCKTPINQSINLSINIAVCTLIFINLLKKWITQRGCHFQLFSLIPLIFISLPFRVILSTLNISTAQCLLGSLFFSFICYNVSIVHLLRFCFLSLELVK